MLSNNLREWILDRIVTDLKIAPGRLQSDTDLTQQGLDSLLAVALVGDLEDLLGRSLSPTLIYDYPTVDALVGYLTADEYTELKAAS